MIPEPWHNHTRTAARTHHYGTIAPMDEDRSFPAERVETALRRVFVGLMLLAAVLIVPVVVHQVIVSTSHEDVRHGSR